jgi:disulfide bond formation protein DsbB
MRSPSTDRLLAFSALASLGAVAVALISQHVFDLQPCAYCVLQRMIFVAIAVVAFVALLLRKGGLQKLLAFLTLLLSAGGVATALYQHNVASQLLSCSQTFADRFVTATGLDEALPAVFGIYASCADAVADLLGVRYEFWSLALFVLTGLASLGVLFARRQSLFA